MINSIHNLCFAISPLQYKYHKQHNLTVICDSILGLHIVDYILKYLVKSENFYLRSKESVVQLCVPNFNVRWLLEKKVMAKAYIFFDISRTCRIFVKKRVLQNHLTKFNQTWYTTFFKKTLFLQRKWKVHLYFQKLLFFSLIQCYCKVISLHKCLLIGTVLYVSDVAQRPLFGLLQLLFPTPF